ncbi:hypothetical protein, partial [Achromobacter sp. MYb9]|uniref:hypothetical protein n=1 Tax=Achromobacter sp. MYb9 TaxID=1827284 RepID=UPI001E2A022C
LAAHGPEPCASTNSATWALVLHLLRRFRFVSCSAAEKRDYAYFFCGVQVMADVFWSFSVFLSGPVSI